MPVRALTLVCPASARRMRPAVTDGRVSPAQHGGTSRSSAAESGGAQRYRFAASYTSRACCTASIRSVVHTARART
jgi:hypothetical protein